MAEGRIHMFHPEGIQIQSPSHYFYEEIRIGSRDSLREQSEDHTVRTSFWQVRSGDTVVDAGSGFGVYTLCALARGAKSVIAFEMNKPVLDCMRLNLGLQGNRPISATENTSTLNWRLNDGKHSIDSFVESLSVPPERIDWLKVDLGDRAETMEALLGGRRTIQKYHPHIVFKGGKEEVEFLKEYSSFILTQLNGHSLVVFTSK